MMFLILAEALKQYAVAQQQIEKVLLVNVALDFGYLLLGLYLIERGRRLEKDRWIGFGKSILLQGAFSFASLTR